MSKILLETEFKDSLGENNFRVKITRYSSDVVYGDAVEVEIRHPEEDFLETYAPEDFPEQLYADLDFRGWSFVLEELKERGIGRVFGEQSRIPLLSLQIRG